MKIGWSTDFLVVDGEQCAADELMRVRASDAEWVLIERMGGYLRYVFSRQEVLAMPRLMALMRQGTDLKKLPLKRALDLHEDMASVQAKTSAELALRAPDPRWPSASRFVEIEGGIAVAVGGADVVHKPKLRSAGSAPAPAAVLPASTPAAAADEGTTPMRFPSIEPKGAVASGAPITLLVDLVPDESAHTVGGVMLPAQPGDWQTIELDVSLQSPAIDFADGGRGKVTVRRNASSIPALITGRVHDGLATGSTIDVKARFLLGTRFCGSAARQLVVGGSAGTTGTKAPDATAGRVQADADAVQPDLTVFITVFDEDAPGKLHWRMVSRPFHELPPRLDGVSKLGRRPEATASAMFRKFATLEPGKHRQAIEGFGEKLWRMSPPEFQAAYWALHDHYQRPLTIQFISDDPYMPWELMSPYRDGEAHGPIALRHAVARWIGHRQGYMPNRLPGGSLIAIAPHYKSASTRLSLAEAAAQDLVDKLGARRVGGTREQLLQLLEKPPAEPVAMVYFTGHGAFAAADADASLIKLEDETNLSAGEVAREKVQLGERYGTVVFLNACEVGATASVLGNVGGWADAFLSRRFGAFIAPLWAIDEEDAKQATEDLMRRIVTDRAPLGAALRDLRQKYGDVSPTFYSYLLYGDVTARLGTA